MAHAISAEEVRAAKAALDLYGNKTAAAKYLGINRTTLRRRLQAEERVAAEKNPATSDWQETRKDDEWVVFSKNPRFQTVEDIVQQAGIDTAVWEVYEVKVNGWDVTAKVRSNEKDQLVTHQNKQIMVRFRRKIPRIAEEAAKAVLERVRKHAPKYKKIKYVSPVNPHMLELSLFDAHFGKHAWGYETNDSHYDLKIAETLYRKAGDDLLSKVAGYQLDQILLPVGQDFLHFDNLAGTTVNETPQERDGRLAKIVGAAFEAVFQMIEKCRLVAPVRVVWVPGNHDMTTSWFLVKMLEQRFWHCREVEIDATPTTRKYHAYGVNLIGFSHGDQEKHHDLPNIMAAEVPQLWARATHREFHLGHLHKQKQTRYLTDDTHVGVPVRILPSLSATDAWHYKKGYVKGRRAAEAYLWSKSDGYTGHFCSNVRDG